LRLGARLAALALAAFAAGPAFAAGLRVASTDQCADQYVLALVPRAEIASLSTRALNPDSYERALAAGLPERRATLEALLAEQPTIVVSYWTPEARLPDALRRQGIAVVHIDEASDFDGVRASVRKVARALGEVPAGEALVARMDARLAAANGRWGGARALYLTPGGFTAGEGTLVSAIMQAAGLRNAARPGYGPVSLEALVLDPPAALVLGFFVDLANGQQHWMVTDARRVEALTGRQPIASLPGAVLGCPAWFAADGSLALAQARR
jgi:iron complex transport system substrate-binding protein